LSKDERRLFVSDAKSHNVVVIDNTADLVTRSIAVGGTPFSVRVSPDGRWLLVGEDSDSKGKVDAVDLQDFRVQHSFDVDRLPYGIEIYGDKAFVACYLSGNVDVLDMATWALETPIPRVAHGDGITIWKGLR
jgi:YVTN family beta-propeller protein